MTEKNIGGYFSLELNEGWEQHHHALRLNAGSFYPNASNPYTPAAYSWPSTFTKEQEEYLTSEIQRLISLLGVKTVVCNID